MPDQLSPRQQQVLAAIQLDPGATLEEIGVQLGITRERVRQISVKLEARGLIRPRVEMRRIILKDAAKRTAVGLARLAFLKAQYKRIRYRQKQRKLAKLPPSGVLEKYLMPGPEATCRYEGCYRAVESRGYCNLHYTRMRALGILWVKRITTPHCVDCGALTYARGYCQRHYEKHRRDGDLKAIQAPKKPNAPQPRSYPRVEQDGKYWMLQTRQPDGEIAQRKFAQKEHADRALQVLLRKKP